MDGEMFLWTEFHMCMSFTPFACCVAMWRDFVSCESCEGSRLFLGDSG